MKIEKVEKVVANLHDKTEYVIHVRNLKQALDHGLFFKKLHRIYYADMNTDVRKKAKNDFEKVFFELSFLSLSFIAYIKTDDIYKDFAEDVETMFDTSNYELDK